MGAIRFGVPKAELKYLQEKLNLKTAIEAGTYLGGSAIELAKIFETVYTIEKSEEIFEIGKKNLMNIRNISHIKGDTREVIENLIGGNDMVLFWIDSHWSGGLTYGKDDECPLIDELRTIFSKTYKSAAIMVDDARLFMAPPPYPNNERNWPTLKEISSEVPEEFEINIWEDVIYITPKSADMRKYLQKRVTIAWKRDKPKNDIISRIKRKMSKLSNKLFIEKR